MAGRADPETPRGDRLNSLPAVNREELESKHLAELHELAAEADIPRYRMLQRGELIKRLSEGDGDRGGGAPRKRGDGRGRQGDGGGKRDRKPRRQSREEREPRQPQPEPQPEPQPAAAAPPPPAPAKPKRKRRRRRWGRRRKQVRVHDLLLPSAHGRQAIVYAESRAACTALLREAAAELADASKGADPIALLVDPSPEELADWRREAPRAELVAAGQARHAEDAIAQATTRASSGEDVVVLIDSLSRFAAEFGDADDAKDLFDAGLGATGAAAGSLSIVAAVERPG